MSAIYWPDFPTFTYLSHLMPSIMGSSRAIGFIFGMRKLEWLGYNLVRITVVWAHDINVTDKQTDRQPRRHSKCRTNALRRAAKSCEYALAGKDGKNSAI